MFDIKVEFPYAAAISSGGATGRIASLGNNPNISQLTAPQDVWSGSVLGTLNGINHAFIQIPQTAVSMEVVSDSANDTAAGTGARTVQVQYLDSNYVAKAVTLTMNGLTPVAMPENVQRINSFIVISSGTFIGNNIGNISIRLTGGLGATYSYMAAGTGIARSSLFTVPDKVQVDLLSMVLSINRTDTNIRAATFSLCNMNQAGRLVKGIELATTSDAPYRHEAANVPLIAYPSRTDVWIRCENVSSNNTNVVGALFGVIRNPINFSL